MTINPNRWTLKTQEAFAGALQTARSASHPEVTPDHLLAALLGQSEGVVLPVVAKLGLQPLALRNQTAEALSHLPNSYGGDDPGLNREMNAVLEAAAERLAETLGGYGLTDIDSGLGDGKPQLEMRLSAEGRALGLSLRRPRPWAVTWLPLPRTATSGFNAMLTASSPQGLID